MEKVWTGMIAFIFLGRWIMKGSFDETGEMR